MKKITNYIFIALILANLFAPFSVVINGTNDIKISQSVVSADETFPSKFEQLKVAGNALLDARAAVKDFAEVLLKERTEEAAQDYAQAQRELSAAEVEFGKAQADAKAAATTNEEKLDLEQYMNSFAAKVYFGPPDPMPACKIIPPRILGCVAQIIYYAVFVPTSYIFGLAGNFFDFTFFYSVNDASYRQPFVLEGWALVRDFVNIFFIFVLLWIAFSTILNVHGFKTKEMVRNVVIIGLVINFSLFATRVIIDTSNILARVFYNENIIKDNSANNKKSKITVSADGVIPLSAAIVSKVNPQKLILEANSVKEQSVRTGLGGAGSSRGFTAGQFILITLLAIAINIVGFFVFLSVGLIFIARVIGLWLAMIFAPLAFFTYMVPGMQSIEMIGIKKWWPETLKMAFLAPIFVFFMYLILKFLSVGSILNPEGKTGFAFVVAIVVPFAFIMILLNKAKGLAVSFSGTIGQAVTKAAVVGGGAALAGGAMTGAFAGRQVLGRSMAALSRTDGAKKMIQYREAMKKWEKGGSVGPAPVKPKIGFIASVGDRINKKKEKVNEMDHGRHEIEDLKKKAGLEGVSDFQLSGVDEKKLSDTYAKAKRAEVEADIRKGAVIGVDSEDTFKNNARARATRDHELATGRSAANFTDADKKQVEGVLNIEFSKYLKKEADVKLDSDFKHLREEAKHKPGALSRVVAGSTGGSYDIRELSKVKNSGMLTGAGLGIAALFGGIFLPIGIALAASTSSAIKKGLKSATGGIDHGSAQRDFLKDLGHTINTALSGMKIDVKVDTGGGDHGHAKADHGGGGHH